MTGQVVPVTGLDSVGLVADMPPVSLPPNAFSDCNNVRFRNGSARKVQGSINAMPHVQYGATDVLKYVAWWPNPNLSSMNRGYYLVIVEQDRIISDATVRRDEVYLLQVGEMGTAEEPITLSATLTDNHKGFFNPGGNWQHTLFQGGFALIINNGLEAPRYVLDNLDNTTTNSIADFVDLPGWASYATDIPGYTGSTSIRVTAAVVRSFGDFLIAGNLVERVSSTGTVIRSLPGIVRTSDIAAPGNVPANWNPFADGVNTADEFVVTGDGIVKDFVELQGKMYIYSNSSISSVTRTGNPSIPFSVSPVTSAYGAITTDSVIEFDGRHFVVGSQDIYLFGGHPGSIQSVSEDKIRRYFYNDLNLGAIEQVFCFRYQQEDEIWLCYPSQDSIEDRADKALVWNYRNNTWSKRDLPNAFNGVVGPVPGGGLPQASVSFTGTPWISNVIDGIVHQVTINGLTDLTMASDGRPYVEVLDLDAIPLANSASDPTLRVTLGEGFWSGADNPLRLFARAYDPADNSLDVNLYDCLPVSLGNNPSTGLPAAYNTLAYRQAVIDPIITQLGMHDDVINGLVSVTRVSDDNALQYNSFDITFSRSNIGLTNIVPSVQITGDVPLEEETDLLKPKDRPQDSDGQDTTVDRIGHEVDQDADANLPAVFNAVDAAASFTSAQINSITRADGAVITFSAASVVTGANLQVGDIITIAGVTGTSIGINGAFTITAISGAVVTTSRDTSAIAGNANFTGDGTGSVPARTRTGRNSVFEFDFTDIWDDIENYIFFYKGERQGIIYNNNDFSDLADTITDMRAGLLQADETEAASSGGVIAGAGDGMAGGSISDSTDVDGNARLNSNFSGTDGIVLAVNEPITGTRLRELVRRSTAVQDNRRLDLIVNGSVDHLNLIAYRIPARSDGDPVFTYTPEGTGLLHLNFWEASYNKGTGEYTKATQLEAITVILTHTRPASGAQVSQNSLYADSVIATINETGIFEAAHPTTSPAQRVEITSIVNKPYILEWELENLAEDDGDTIASSVITQESFTQGIAPYSNSADTLIPDCIRIRNTDPDGINYFTFDTGLIELRGTGDGTLTIAQQRQIIEDAIEARAAGQWSRTGANWSTSSVFYDQSLGHTGVPHPEANGTYQFPAERNGANWTIDYFSPRNGTAPTASVVTQGRYEDIVHGSYLAMLLSNNSTFLFPISGNNIALDLEPQLVARIPQLSVTLTNSDAGLSLQPSVVGENAVFVRELYFNSELTIAGFNKLLDASTYTQDEGNVTLGRPLPDAVLTNAAFTFEHVPDGPIVSGSNIVTDFDVDRTWSADEVDFSYEFPIFSAGRRVSTNTLSNAVVASEIGWSALEFSVSGIRQIAYKSFVERKQMAMAPEFDTEHLYGVALWLDGSTPIVHNGSQRYNVLQLNLSASDNPGQVVDLSNPQFTNTHYISEDYKMDTRLTGRFLNWNLTDAVTGTLSSPGGKTFSQQTEWNLSGIQMELRKSGRR